MCVESTEPARRASLTISWAGTLSTGEIPPLWKNRTIFDTTLTNLALLPPFPLIPSMPTLYVRASESSVCGFEGEYNEG